MRFWPLVMGACLLLKERDFCALFRSRRDMAAPGIADDDVTSVTCLVLLDDAAHEEDDIHGTAVCLAAFGLRAEGGASRWTKATTMDAVRGWIIIPTSTRNTHASQHTLALTKTHVPKAPTDNKSARSSVSGEPTAIGTFTGPSQT